MAKKGKRELITLACSECRARNIHTTKNIQNQKDKVELKKFCKKCRKHTIHKEAK